jgi:hypothetical protein
MTSMILSSLRKQGNISRIHAAPPAALLQGSSTSPSATLAHSYTPIVQLDHLLVSIKGDVQGLPKRRRAEVGRVGETRRRLTQTTQGQTLSLSLSLALATLVTPTASTPPVQDNISLIPPLVFHLASTHLDWGTRHQIHWSVRLRVLTGPKRRQQHLTKMLREATSQMGLQSLNFTLQNLRIKSIRIKLYFYSFFN